VLALAPPTLDLPTSHLSVVPGVLGVPARSRRFILPSDSLPFPASCRAVASSFAESYGGHVGEGGSRRSAFCSPFRYRHLNANSADYLSIRCDLLAANGGRTAEDFAAARGIERSIAFRFLRACTKIGLIACDDGRTFKSTSRLQTLHGETPGSMRNKAMVLGTRAQYLIWSEFLTAVRTNQRQAATALGAPIFDYYADHPDEAGIFRATMQSVSEGVASGIASMLDTSTYSVAVDVGGADGALVHSLMRHNPQLRDIVLDRPEVAPAAAAAAKARGLAERTEAIGGDFFRSVPEGDLYLLRFILRDWDDTAAIRILKTCRRSTKPDARLVVIEAFFAEPGEKLLANMIDTQVPLFDLHLMLAVNGKERTLAEYSLLFDKVGLRTIKTTPLDNGYVVIETAAA
jgi:hypothetical protein